MVKVNVWTQMFVWHHAVSVNSWLEESCGCHDGNFAPRFATNEEWDPSTSSLHNVGCPIRFFALSAWGQGLRMSTFCPSVEALNMKCCFAIFECQPSDFDKILSSYLLHLCHQQNSWTWNNTLVRHTGNFSMIFYDLEPTCWPTRGFCIKFFLKWSRARCGFVFDIPSGCDIFPGRFTKESRASRAGC